MIVSLMPSLKVYLFAVFALTVFGMGSASADNNTDGDENNDLGYQTFFIKEEGDMLSPELSNGTESTKTVNAQYDNMIGMISNPKA